MEKLHSPKDSDKGDKPHGSGDHPVSRKDLKELLEKILMKQDQLAADLVALKAQVAKVGNEQGARFDALTAKIAELEAVIAAGGDVTTEVTDALQGVKDALQGLDDTIPDPVPEPPPVP